MSVMKNKKFSVMEEDKEEEGIEEEFSYETKSKELKHGI